MRVLWKDGTWLGALPAEGMDGFDPEAARSRFEGRWGTHSLKDGVLTLARGAETELLRAQPDGSYRTAQNGPVLRIPPATGLRLDGLYRLREGADRAKAPGLVLRTDGTFLDRGGIAAVLPAGQDPPAEEGPCRYEIANHTLFLAYPKARFRRTSLLVVPKAGGGGAPDLLLLGGRWFGRESP